MSDFKANIHQIWFRLGCHPRPRWGSLRRSADPWLDLRGHTYGQRRVGKGKGKELP